MNAVEVDALTFAYPGMAPTLHAIDLVVPAGEFLVLAGPSGSGKSTLLRAMCGLVPHASGGRFDGDVRVHGRSTREFQPRQLADVVGFVNQDPEAQFVVDEVERDIAFVLENLATAPATMRRRVEEVLDALGIAHLRHRPPGSLSGGEKQRCAIAGTLAAGPAVLVLDEPTSQLDPQGAEDVLGALARLNADLGITMVIAEHRLERVAPMADRVCVLSDGTIAIDDAPGPALVDYPGAPPVTHLGRLMHWDPPPLTVKDARRLAFANDVRVDGAVEQTSISGPTALRDVVLRASRAAVALGGRTVVGPLSLQVARGEILALLGRNGAGKTTLLRALAGLVALDEGVLEIREPIAYVPQDPNSLLFSPTARREVAHTLRLLGGSKDDALVAHWLELLGLADLAERHPRTLSGGERQRLAVAAVAVGGATGLLLDETTRGMDAPSRAALEVAIRQHVGAGGLVILATHDVELAARVATRVVVLGDGDIVADGPAREVLAGSLFAPQMLRVLPPALTVDEVANTIVQNGAR